MNYKILVINPGSTSTKIAVFHGEERVFEKSLAHTPDELKAFNDILEQKDFRKDVIMNTLSEGNIDCSQLDAVVARGGMLPNMKAGGYIVNQAMIDTINEGLASPHASNLGAVLAYEIAEKASIPSYIYDAVTADELMETAKITGMAGVTKHCIAHVLNSKAVSREIAGKYGKTYETLNVIVAHLGGGPSVSAHMGGKIVDCIRDDEGAFSPERSGGIPSLCMIDECFSGKYTKQDMIKRVRGNGGMQGYLGTQNMIEIEKRIEEGDKKAELYYDAMVLQISKGIGQLAPVFCGNVDCIIITGGIAHSKKITSMISERVKFIAPVEIMPGEKEMEALAAGTVRILAGSESAREYVHP